MHNIRVTRQQDDLTQQEWTFWFDDRTAALILSHYTFSKRETKRHKFKPSKWYDRYDRRGNTIKNVADLPFPDDVTAEAKQQLVDQITVKLDRDE